MFNRPPVVNMSDPTMREAEFQSNYIARVFGLREAFRELSSGLKGVVHPGEIVQLSAQSWRHRVEVVDSGGFGPVGSVCSRRYLALTNEGLRVVEETRHATRPGEESSPGKPHIIGEPNILTAMRVAWSDTPDSLRERSQEIVAARQSR